MESDSKKCKFETVHNRIELSQRAGLLELRSADGALQSVIDPDNPQRLALKNLEFMLGSLLFIPQPRRVLLLGTAGGSLLHFLRHYFECEITAVDIDAELVDGLLQRRLLPAAGQGLSYVFDDAARFIEHTDKRFDLVLVDLFHGAKTPRWLLDKATSAKLRGLLAEQGALAYNLLIDSETDFRRFYRDLRLVFERQSLCLPVPGFENTLVYAFRGPLAQRDMDWYRRRALDYRTRCDIDFMQILAVIYNTNPVGGGVL